MTVLNGRMVQWEHWINKGVRRPRVLHYYPHIVFVMWNITRILNYDTVNPKFLEQTLIGWTNPCRPGPWLFCVDNATWVVFWWRCTRRMHSLIKWQIEIHWSVSQCTWFILTIEYKYQILTWPRSVHIRTNLSCVQTIIDLAFYQMTYPSSCHTGVFNQKDEVMRNYYKFVTEASLPIDIFIFPCMW